MFLRFAKIIKLNISLLNVQWIAGEYFFPQLKILKHTKEEIKMKNDGKNMSK